MWRSAFQPLKNKVIFGNYAWEYSRNLSVSEQKLRQKSPYSWEVDRHIFTSPRYGEVDRQIWLSYFRQADRPSPLLSLFCSPVPPVSPGSCFTSLITCTSLLSCFFAWLNQVMYKSIVCTIGIGYCIELKCSLCPCIRSFLQQQGENTGAKKSPLD